MAAPADRIRILFLEDNPSDIELTVRHMARHAPHFDLEPVSLGKDALDLLSAQPFDAAVLDFQLPDQSGLEVLEELTRRRLELPALMVTGSGDTETALKALKAGAFDYVVKKEGYLETLPAAIEGAIARFRSQAHLVRRHAIQVLYAEHNAPDVDLTLRHFRTHAPRVAFEVARTGQEAIRRLRAGEFDLLLLDYRLQDMDGIQVLRELREGNLSVPVVMVTGRGDEDIAVQALKLGALDYVVKRGDYLERLPAIIESAVGRHRLAEEREALIILNGLARAVASSMNLDEIFRQVTEAACTLLKVDQCLLSLLDDEGVTLRPAAWRGIEDEVARGLVYPVGEGLPGQAAQYRRTMTAPGGAEGAPFALSASTPIQHGDQIFGILSVGHTATRQLNGMELALIASLASHAAIAIQNARLYQELKRSYEELKRSQDLLFRQEKMAALGRLAAGLAHELNNPLAAVAGFAENLHRRMEMTDLSTLPSLAELPRQLKLIMEQAFRCGEMVHRLLTYARQREPQRKVGDLWQIVEDSLALLPGKIRMLGRRFERVHGPGSLAVLADPTMLQQVILNLVTNALDAVEGGGTVRLAAYRDEADGGAGSVVLEVTDTGMGIPPENLGFLFDPFFTTKGPERGTGLGLPICLSIVEQHGGSLQLHSAGVGHGCTATVRLPAAP